MELTLHENTEEANATLSILSFYYNTLADNFIFYSSLQPQVYSLKENELITIQSFIHFLKLLDIASTRGDLYNILEKLDGLVPIPLEDTLNIKNGINYA
jgi:hypothetical protein